MSHYFFVFILSTFLSYCSFGQPCEGVVYFSIFDSVASELKPSPLHAVYDHAELRAINDNCDSIVTITGIKISNANEKDYSSCPRLQAFSSKAWYFEQRLSCNATALKLIIEKNQVEMEIDFLELKSSNIYTLDSIPFMEGNYNLIVDANSPTKYQLMLK